MARMTGMFSLDGSYRRHDRVVIAGSPLRLFRLSPAGQRVVEAIEKNETLPPTHKKLTDRLMDAGAIHPNPAESAHRAEDVTVVIPAFNDLAAAFSHRGESIVVDDASDPPLQPTAGSRTIRLADNRGAGAARNAGLAEVTTPLVAFVDTDVAVDDRWLDALLPHFNDPSVALVAPRVASAPGSSTLEQYEAARSPLDLGDQAARIAAGTRVSYVPAAALVVRTEMLRAIGGFDESLRTGEDVDMVWRLIDAGYRCRYEPLTTVHHRPRSTLSALIRQRVGYGRSATVLERKHPGAVAPLRISGWSAAVWSLVFVRRSATAAIVAAGTIVALRRKLDDLPAQESVRLAGLGHLYAGRQVAGAVTRVWWPLALLVALLVPRARPALLAAATVPAALDWRGRRGPGSLTQYIALRLVDDAAYGAGVWLGAIEQRSVVALAPRFTNWPGRAAG
jgi:mycofactocin system glycosyltransferase